MAQDPRDYGPSHGQGDHEHPDSPLTLSVNDGQNGDRTTGSANDDNGSSPMTPHGGSLMDMSNYTTSYLSPRTAGTNSGLDQQALEDISSVVGNRISLTTEQEAHLNRLLSAEESINQYVNTSARMKNSYTTSGSGDPSGIPRTTLDDDGTDVPNPSVPFAF